MKILAVDDTPLMLISIRRILERNGHDVLSTDNGENALDILLGDVSIDLIITDLIMPDISGIELCKRVRTLKRFNDKGPVSSPPMILMTGHPLCQTNGDIPLEFGLLYSHFEAIVEKPVVEENLLAAIRIAEASFDYDVAQLTELRTLLQQALNELSCIRSPGELSALAEQIYERLGPLRTSPRDSDSSDTTKDGHNNHSQMSVP